MMRRLLLAAALVLSATSQAFADAERVERLASAIAQEAVVRAHALERAPAAPAFAPPPGDSLLANMQDFALAALALSDDIEARGGPQDLRCIFRGMGGDVEARIETLLASQSRADQSRAYRDIEALARQAERIAADPQARTDGLTPTCEAE